MIRLKYITIFITIFLLTGYNCNPRTKVKETIIDKNTLTYEDKLEPTKKAVTKPKKAIRKPIVKPEKTIRKPIVKPKKAIRKPIVKPKKTIKKSIVKPKKTIKKSIVKPEKTIKKSIVKNRKEILKELYKKYKQDFKKRTELLKQNILMTPKEEKNFDKKLITNIKLQNKSIKHELLGCSIEAPKTFKKINHNPNLWQLLYSKNKTNIKLFIGISKEKVKADKLFEQLKTKYTKLGSIKWPKHSQLKKDQLKKHNALTGLYTKTSYITTNFTNLIYISVFQNKNNTAFIIGVLSLGSNNKKDNTLKSLGLIVNKILQSFVFI